MKKYTAWYVNSCRAIIDEGVKVYRKQFSTPPSKEFETQYFNNLIFSGSIF